MKSSHLPGAFMIAFLACTAAAARAGIAGAYEEAGTASAQTLLDGRWISRYERIFNKKTAIYEWSVSAWGILNYALFREGSDGVLVGRDGWLFTREEFDYLPHQEKDMRENVEYMAAVRDKLAGRGIRLIVALVPAKARIYRDMLTDYEFPSYRERVYDDALRQLRGRGVRVADLRSAMMQRAGDGHDRLFLRTDTHWTPAGAALAARRVARDIRQQWPDLFSGKKDFVTVRSGTEPYRGDLLRYLPLGPFAQAWEPRADTLVLYHTASAPAGEERGTDAASGLFANASVPAVLVGTSYSANEKWNFAGFLQEYLQGEILNVAEEGRGPFHNMQKYLSDGSFLQTPPRIVIWEVPERYLPVAYELETQAGRRQQETEEGNRI